jgi:hypothetical protein
MGSFCRAQTAFGSIGRRRTNRIFRRNSADLYQANFESRFINEGRWQNNAHLNIAGD